MTPGELKLSRQIGERLRYARNSKGLSLGELLELTGGTFSKSRISSYAQGLRRMSIEAARRSPGLVAALPLDESPHALFRSRYTRCGRITHRCTHPAVFTLTGTSGHEKGPAAERLQFLTDSARDASAGLRYSTASTG